jgi:hypothetical protein
MTPEEHEAKFTQLCWNLIKLAEQLTAQNPDYPRFDIGRVFITVGIGLMSSARGDAATGAYLAEIVTSVTPPDEDDDPRGSTN